MYQGYVWSSGFAHVFVCICTTGGIINLSKKRNGPTDLVLMNLEEIVAGNYITLPKCIKMKWGGGGTTRRLFHTAVGLAGTMINAFRRFDTEHGAEQSPVGQYSWWSLQMLRGFLQICV